MPSATSSAKSYPRQAALSLGLLVAAILSVFAGFELGPRNPFGAGLAIIGILLFLAADYLFIVATLAWWKRADEVVKEAHKTAWLWGGPVGLGVWILLPLTPVAGWAEDVASNYFDFLYGSDGSSAFIAGGVTAYLCMIVGYGVWLAAWWVAKR